MGITYRKDAWTRAVCAFGHEVEVFAADGVVTTRLHQDNELLVDFAGKAHHRKCPACEETAKRLICQRVG